MDLLTISGRRGCGDISKEMVGRLDCSTGRANAGVLGRIGPKKKPEFKVAPLVSGIDGGFRQLRQARNRAGGASAVSGQAHVSRSVSITHRLPPRRRRRPSGSERNDTRQCVPARVPLRSFSIAFRQRERGGGNSPNAEVRLRQRGDTSQRPGAAPPTEAEQHRERRRGARLIDPAASCHCCAPNRSRLLGNGDTASARGSSRPLLCC